MIKDNKKLPKGLIEKQELQRQETINKVLRVCADIKIEGGKVTISALAEHTGLARSTFAKSHIRELLTEREYSAGAGTAVAKGKKANQAEIFAEKDRQIVELRAKNTKLEKEGALLRGNLFNIQTLKTYRR